MLEIIRTSIDRLDISICVFPIPKGKINCYEQLHFLLDQAVESSDGGLTPEKIPKTIVFVDGRRRIAAVSQYLKESLVQKGYSARLVNQMVGIYTSHVAKHDQDRIYNIFRSEQSDIRIMVATTALGMGMDIPDVDRVVQWNFPITDDVGDLWQRFGRAARGRNKTGVAIFFAPYWAFNRLGYQKESTEEVTSRITSEPKRRRNMLSRDCRASRLQQSFSQGSSRESDSDHDGNLSDQYPYSNRELDGTATDQSTGKNKVHPWTKQEIKSRDSMSDCWRAMLNSDCYRKYPLEFLQEDKCDPETQTLKAPRESCCNGIGCNPNFLVITTAPTAPVSLRKPTLGSKQGIALQWLVKWCRVQADELVLIEERFAPMPSSYFLPSHYQWAIVRAFDKVTSAAEFPIRTVEDLRKYFPLDKWKHATAWGEQLVQFLRQNVDSILAEWLESRKSKKVVSSTSDSSPRSSSASNSKLTADE